GPENPRAGQLLQSRWPDAGRWPKPVGGLYASAADRSTLRNTISQYIHLADGGEWIESSQYNLNTLKLLLSDAEMVRTAAEKDPFPELKPLLPKLALEQIYELTPDLRDSYQWGDQEHPHDLRLLKRMPCLQILAGLTQGDPAGPYIQELVLELSAQHGYHGARSAEPMEVTGLLLFNPFAPHADWRAVLPPSLYAPGMGILLVHNGWQPTDSLFGAQMSTHPQVDHEVQYFGDFRLYRHGEWVIDHPLGYGALAVSGEAVNTVLLGGLSSMQEVREPIAQETGQHGEYAYIAGTTRGQPYARTNQPKSNPRQIPAPFVHEWTRSLVYLPSPDKQSDTVVVFDRVNAQDPKQVAGYHFYRPPDRKRIESAPALKQWLIHSPVAPNVSAGGLNWRTPGNQTVEVRTLLPVDQQRQVYNEADLWGKSHSIPLKWRRFQTRITPAHQATWDTFLNVIQVSDRPGAFQAQLVESKGKEAEGTFIQRPQLDDVVVLFGARPQARLLQRGYEATWTGKASQTLVHLFDLDPARSWKVTVDGDTATPLTVSSQGVAHVIIHGSGNHRLALSAR
ncbi:MAG TPA: hypothetical protein VFA18_15555, partial [Gemmataceae bacterium]|nr:hypothetical protein [Gemmataceae bacterium]